MSPGDGGRFDLAPVAGKRRVGPVVAVIAAAVVVGMGLWKPWSSPAGARPELASAAPPVALGSAGPSAAPATPNRRPPGADTPAAGSRPPLFGLNLAYMGSRVGRTSWGVAAAYVPLAEIVRADAIDRPWVTPVLDWQSLEPDPRTRGPILDRSETATVALAVTWPAGSDPRAVQLEYLRPASPNPLLSMPSAPRLIPLDAALLPLMSPVPWEWFAIERSARPAWEGQSGTFFLPPVATPSDPADWLTGGWPPGEYAFRLELDDGTTARLPFVLGG